MRVNDLSEPLRLALRSQSGAQGKHWGQQQSPLRQDHDFDAYRPVAVHLNLILAGKLGSSCQKRLICYHDMIKPRQWLRNTI
jgi:hypothetical protein